MSALAVEPDPGFRPGTAAVVNAYARAVTREGNVSARKLLEEVFGPVDLAWRGIGPIPLSGQGAACISRAGKTGRGQVSPRTGFGVERILDLPSGDQLPRICCERPRRGRTVMELDMPHFPCMIRNPDPCLPFGVLGRVRR